MVLCYVGAMDPVQKALWFVESHLQDPLTLDEVASHSGASPYHLTRAFAAVTGHSLMRYVRARRLSEAAQKLALGPRDILTVALDAGYGSHEAFTRAFREQFGLTPEQLRARGHVNDITLREPIAMDSTPLTTLDQPRFETSKPLLLAGIAERYNCEVSAGIPAQWQRLQPFFGGIPKQVGQTAYGACYNFDDEGNFDYMCAVEVADFSDLPAGFTTLRVPAQRYAVFHQRGHISTIRSAFAAIWSKWVPASGHEVADAPTLERYGAEFNPTTGTGGFEIWIPIKA
jgi:AraC family transcriptional regulator